MPRINQVQIKSDIGLDFASVLRVALRQDLMFCSLERFECGISRDCPQVSMITWYFRLYTNDAVSATHRLIDMGVESISWRHP